MDLTCCELEIQTKQNMVREDVFHFKFQFFLEEAELHMFFLSTMRLHQTNHKNPTHQKMPPSPERAGFNGWLWSPIFPQSITVVPCCWSHERPKDGILFHGSEGYQCFGISDKENMVAWGMLGLVLPFLYRDHLAYHANPYWPSSLKGWDKFLVCPGGSNAFKPRCVHSGGCFLQEHDTLSRNTFNIQMKLTIKYMYGRCSWSMEMCWNA